MLTVALLAASFEGLHASKRPVAAAAAVAGTDAVAAGWCCCRVVKGLGDTLLPAALARPVSKGWLLPPQAAPAAAAEAAPAACWLWQGRLQTLRQGFVEAGRQKGLNPAHVLAGRT